LLKRGRVANEHQFARQRIPRVSPSSSALQFNIISWNAHENENSTNKHHGRRVSDFTPGSFPEKNSIYTNTILRNPTGVTQFIYFDFPPVNFQQQP
jgi:hypothetical protein